MSPTDTTAVDFPPVVYVPCTRHTAVPEELEVRYQTTKDGRRAVLVYSALDRLHRCCGDDYADQVAGLVAKLAGGPTRAYAATKQAMNATTLRSLDETLERELRLQRELADTADSQEGIQAFLDKRPARFEGR